MNSSDYCLEFFDWFEHILLNILSKGNSQTNLAFSLYISWQIWYFIKNALESHEHIRTNLHVIIKAIEQFIIIMMHK